MRCGSLGASLDESACLHTPWGGRLSQIPYPGILVLDVLEAQSRVTVWDVPVQDASSELQPSTTGAAAADAAARHGDGFAADTPTQDRRRSLSGADSAAAAAAAVGAKVSSVWNKVKARTTVAGRGEE